MPTTKTFQLWVTVQRWIDGDSFAGYLDQGYYTYKGREAKPIAFRCAVINAPEKKGNTLAAGLEATLHASRIAPLGDYPCHAYKPDEYGRPLVDLILPDGRLFSAAMLDAGHAVLYKK